jgi:hypothetical protein
MGIEGGFFDFVVFRIDGIIHGGAEVGLFQVAVIEGRPGQIAMIENGGGQVGFGEIWLTRLRSEPSGWDMRLS